MAATIGRLKAVLTADTGPFRKNMLGARKDLRKFSSSIGAAAKTVAKYAASLAALVGAGGLGMMVKSQFALMDSVGKVSDKLGIATEDLLALRHAAELTGVQAKTFDMALQRMTRRLSEAAQGTGEAIAALDELGLEAEALAKMTPDKAFRRIADAMLAVEKQSDRVRLAFKLFDSEGVALVNTLMLGSAGLRQQAEELRKLGGMFSRIDAAQIEAANDAFTRLGQAIKGAARLLSVKLAPTIEGLARSSTKSVQDAITFFEQWGKTIGRTIVAVVSFRAALKGIVLVQKSIAKSQAIIVSLLGPKGWLQLAGAALAAAVSLAVIDNAFGRLEQSSRAAREEVERYTRSIEDVSKIDILASMQDSVSGIQRELEQLQALLQAATPPGAMSLDTLKIAIEDVETALKRATANRDEFARALERSNAVQAAAEAAAKLAKMQEEASRAATQLGKDIGKLETNLRLQLDTFGQSAAQIELYKLKMRGATKAVLENAAALTKQLDELREQQRLIDRAAQIIESVMTPLERNFRDKDRLKELFDAGLLSAEQLRRALQQITDEFDRATSAAAGLNVASNLRTDPRLGEFRQVESIRRLALQGVQAVKLTKKEPATEKTAVAINGLLARMETMLERGLPIAWT